MYQAASNPRRNLKTDHSNSITSKSAAVILATTVAAK